MQFEPSETRAFFEALFEDVPGYIDIRFIELDGSTRRETFEDVEDALAAIAACEGHVVNIHPCPVTRKTGGHEKNEGGKSNISHTRALWTDIDVDGPEEHESALDELKKFPIPPSVVISSGRGIHAYWILEEAVELSTEEVIEEFENVLVGLADILGGDLAVTHAAAAMRAPGTTNHPNSKKQEKGRVPALCTILENSGYIYSSKDFADLEERGSRIGRGRPGAKLRKVVYEREQFEGTCPEAVTTLLEATGRKGKPRYPKLVRRWTGDMEDLGGNQSASELDMSIATSLAVLDVEPGDIENALRFRRAETGDKKKHAGYYVLTVSKAMAYCEERHARDDAAAGASLHQASDPVRRRREGVQSVEEGRRSRIPKDWLATASITTFFDGDELLEPPEREWVFEKVIPAGVVALVAGEGGVGKGRLILAMAIAWATGTAFGPFKTPRPLRVAIIGKEDDRVEQHRRIYFTLQARSRFAPELTAAQVTLLKENLLIPDFVPGLILGDDLVEAIEAYRVENSIDVIIIDPLTRFWGRSDEVGSVNSQEGAGWVHDQLARIQQITGATVMAVHHVNKIGLRSTSRDKEQQSSHITGSAQLVDLARLVLQIAPEERETQLIRLELPDTRQVVRVDVTKTNYSKKPDRPFHFALVEGGGLVPVHVPTREEQDADKVDLLIQDAGAKGVSRKVLMERAKKQHDVSQKRFQAVLNRVLQEKRAKYRGTRSKKGSKRLYALKSNRSASSPYSLTDLSPANLLHGARRGSDKPRGADQLSELP